MTISINRKFSRAAGIAMLAFFVMPQGFAAIDDKSSSAETANTTQQAIKDAWLQGKLETALLFNEHLNSFAIDTEVTQGIAYLSGKVESDIDRDLAGEIAESIKGIDSVENDLVVDKAAVSMEEKTDTSGERRAFRTAVSDATMTARIKSELLVNRNTAGLSINVDTRNGNVTLSGEVSSEQEKELAEKIADNTNGEGSVDNQLVVSRKS